MQCDIAWNGVRQVGLTHAAGRWHGGQHTRCVAGVTAHHGIPTSCPHAHPGPLPGLYRTADLEGVSAGRYDGHGSLCDCKVRCDQDPAACRRGTAPPWHSRLRRVRATLQCCLSNVWFRMAPLTTYIKAATAAAKCCAAPQPATRCHGGRHVEGSCDGATHTDDTVATRVPRTMRPPPTRHARDAIVQRRVLACCA